MAVRACIHGTKYVITECSKGNMTKEQAGMILLVPACGLGVACYVYGPGNVFVWSTTSDPTIILEPGEGLSDEERESRHDLFGGMMSVACE